MTSLQLLTEATKVCPTCEGKGKRHAGLIPDACLTCNGTGKVLLIPGLRKACPQCDGVPKRYDPLECGHCRGKGWVPVSEAEALVAIAEHILTQPDADGFFRSLTIERPYWFDLPEDRIPNDVDRSKVYVALVLSLGGSIEGEGEGETIAEALAQAQCWAQDLKET